MQVSIGLEFSVDKICSVCSVNLYVRAGAMYRAAFSLRYTKNMAQEDEAWDCLKFAAYLFSIFYLKCASVAFRAKNMSL
jgi:hypothetical protein